MLRSQDRILTTHTGSLPRPAALTQLYVRGSRGEPIDTAELDRVGKQAVRDIVTKQITAGIDVPNNGEQQREAFFLYVRHRMSGFGGGWTRRVFADATRYPEFMAWKTAHDGRPMHHIPHQLHHGAAETHHHDRTEGRIVHHADHQLASARRHSLHQDAFDQRIRLVALCRRHDVVKSGDHGLALFQA
jgi:hypothetical protein